MRRSTTSFSRSQTPAATATAIRRKRNGDKRAGLCRAECFCSPLPVNKRALLDRILVRLQSELDLLTRAALATHAEATDEENKAEDKYDTRGLEASYLAIGQSKAAEEAAQAVAQFSSLSLRDFRPSEPISLGALVVLEANGHSTYYFMGPRAGGTEIEEQGAVVMVITPQSPLGRQLMGRLDGDILELTLGGKRSQQIIASVR